jgi:hypothetical protein
VASKPAKTSNLGGSAPQPQLAGPGSGCLTSGAERQVGTYDSSTGPAGVPGLYGLADEDYGSGVSVSCSIWLRQRQSGQTGLFVGFVADDEAEVNAV